MSRRIRKWERGAADLVTIAVGLTIVAITAIGTSYSLLYGRQALIQQEHYKTALYKLRGFMEEEVARYRFSAGYRSNYSWANARREVTVDLDTPTDRNGDIQVTTATLWRAAFSFKDDILTGVSPDFFKIEAHAVWTEPVGAGIVDGEANGRIDGPTRQIDLVQYFKIPE